MKKILFLFCVGICHIAFSQGIKVVDVKEVTSGTAAFHAPKDDSGKSCGLIKVQSVITNLSFDGDVVGEVFSENNEYQVFTANGSKRLIIKRPHVLPTIVNFSDYGIDCITSKATYVIKLKDVSLHPQKNSLVVNTKPKDAKVYIDDILIENNNGGSQLLLPKGEHLCKIEAIGFRSFASVITIGKEPQTLDAELESLLSDIEITSRTNGAHIYINGKEMGVGSWKGSLPAGSYTIETRLNGYFTQTQSLELGEKEVKTITTPALERANGIVTLKVKPSIAIVLFDGKRWDEPNKPREVRTGAHKLMVKTLFGYKPMDRDVEVKAGVSDTIEVSLQPVNEIYARAFAGDIKAQTMLCAEKFKSSIYEDKDTIDERNYWCERLFENLERMDKQSFDIVCPHPAAANNYPPSFIQYFKKTDRKKALNVLLKWYNLDHGGGNDWSANLVVGDIRNLFLEQKNYEEAIKWGIIEVKTWKGWNGDINLTPVFEPCIEMGDINRAIDIAGQYTGSEDYDWDDVFYQLACIYKSKGDCKNAVNYFRKVLLNPQFYLYDDVKKAIKDCGY